MSPEEQTAFAESIHRVQAAARLALDGGSSRARLVAELHRGVDRVTWLAQERGVALACQPGCAHCCEARVEVLPDEAGLIAQALRDWPEPAQAELRQTLLAQARQRRAQPWVRLPCALLREQRCSVYAARPAACRKAHSLDAQACAEAAPQIPQELALLLDAEALMLGVGQALDAPPQELALAVMEKLDHV